MTYSLIPFTENISKVIDETQKLFNSAFWDNVPYYLTDNRSSKLRVTGTLPKLDIIDLPDKGEVAVVFDVHGYDKKDLKITINEQDNSLTIVTGKLGTYDDVIQTKEPANYIIKEIKKSSSKRTLEFPETVDITSIKTKYKEGYIIVKIKYKKSDTEKEIKIQ